MGTCSTWSLSQPLGTWAPSQVMGAASDCRKQVAQRGTPGAYYGRSCSSLGQEQLAEARGPPPGTALPPRPPGHCFLWSSAVLRKRDILYTCVERASYKVRANSLGHLPLEVCGDPPCPRPGSRSWEDLKFLKDQFKILQNLLQAFIIVSLNNFPLSHFSPKNLI